MNDLSRTSSSLAKYQSGVPEDPHAPSAMERERIASRRYPQVTPTDKRKHMVSIGLSTPSPPMSGGMPRCTRLIARCEESAGHNGSEC